MSSITAYAAESDDPELYEFAYSLGADKDYLGVYNYSHDDEEYPFNNDCYVDFLHHCSLLEAAYAPQETYRSVISSGSCMGISILEVLAHNGVIKPSDIQEGAETLSEITYNESSDRYITDYQSLQGYTLLDSYEKYLITATTYEEQIDRLIGIAERCTKDNKYFLITFRTHTKAHAICGIGIKEGSWTFNDTNYDKCVLVLDSNHADKEGNRQGFSNKGCIYINSETKQSYIPSYDISSDNDSKLSFSSIDDETILNYKGFINPSKKTDTDLSKLKHFMTDNSSEIQKIDIYAVFEDGSSSLVPKAKLGDISGQHVFFESDSVHVEVRNRIDSIDLRYINFDRWIDLEAFTDRKVCDCDFDFSDKGLSINNKGPNMFWTDYQIRMNRDTFNFEPVYFWLMTSKITDDLKVEICDEGLLFKSSGRIDATVAPYYYTLDEDSNYLSVMMSVNPDNSANYLYSDNDVLVKADADHNVSYFIDDNNDDIYDTQIQKGDINCDGNINAVDASLALSLYAANSVSIAQTISPVGDYNNDGSLDAIDASQILAEYARIATSED